MPLPFILGAASAALPSVVDWISGASADRRAALRRRNAALDALLADTQREIGPNVTDSVAYKAGQGLLDENFRRSRRRLNAQGIASGATPEATLGGLETLSHTYNMAGLRNLGYATNRRDMLKRQYAALMGERTNADVADANETLAMQGRWTQGITQLLPHLFGMNEDDPTKTKPEGT